MRITIKYCSKSGEKISSKRNISTQSHRSPLGSRKLRLRSLQEKLTDESFKNRPIDYWYDRRIDAIVSNLHERNHFDVVVAEYVVWSRCLKLFGGNVRKIVDTIDVLSNRYEVLKKAKVPPPFWPWGSVSLTPADEGKGLDRSDIVLTISDDDRDSFRSVTSRPIVTVGHILPKITPPGVNGVRNKLLFVGSAWAPNFDGLARFINEILPKVKQQVPDAELLVAGSICWHLPDSLACTKLGVLDDLGEAYAAADLAINPVEWGSGMCIKSIEALGHSLPLISFASGAEGCKRPSASQSLLPSRMTSLRHRSLTCYETRRRSLKRRMTLTHSRPNGTSNRPII